MVAPWLIEAATSYNRTSVQNRDGYSAFVLLPVRHLETILIWAFESLPDEILIGFDPLQSMPIDEEIIEVCSGADYHQDLFAGQGFVIGEPHLVNRGDSFSVHHVPEEWVDELFAADRGSRGARFTHWMHTHPNCVAIPSAADADASSIARLNAEVVPLADPDIVLARVDYVVSAGDRRVGCGKAREKKIKRSRRQRRLWFRKHTAPLPCGLL